MPTLEERIRKALPGFPVDPVDFDNVVEVMAAFARTVQEEARAVPGQWYCPECGFIVHKSILAPNGIFVNERDDNEICPNDGTPLGRRTWKMCAEDALDYVRTIAQETRENTWDAAIRAVREMAPTIADPDDIPKEQHDFSEALAYVVDGLEKARAVPAPDGVEVGT